MTLFIRQKILKFDLLRDLFYKIDNFEIMEHFDNRLSVKK